MRSIYFATFLLGENEKERPVEMEEAISLVEHWLFEKRSFSKPPDFVTLSNEKYNIEPNFIVDTRYLEKTSDQDPSRIFGLRFEHPDSELRQRNWQTSIVISAHESSVPKVRVSVDVSIGSSESALAPLRITPSRPRIVPHFIETFGARDAFPLKSQHVSIGEEDAEQFLQLLTSSERRLPVLFISARNSTDRPPIDPNSVANFMAGLGYVCVATSSEVSRKIRSLIDNSLNAYDGGIRLYWPGFSLEDSPFRHPRWLPWQVEELEARPGGFRSRALGLVASVSTTRQVDDVCRWEDVERVSARLDRHKLRETGDTDELVKIAEDMIAELEMQVEEQKKQLDKLNLEVEAKQSEADQWRIAYQEAKIQISGHGEVDDNRGEDQRAPNSLREIIESIEDKYTGKIEFLRNRIEEDAYLFENTEALQAVLEWLVTIYAASKAGVRNCPDLDHSCKEASGFSYTGHQSDVTMGKYKDDYYVTWGGKKRELREHIRYGTGRDPRYSIRLAFFYDSDKKKVVVGYIGQHQRTSKS
jgi:hypothetical protein